MEGKLFLISLWCGMYGLLLRLVFKWSKLSGKTPVVMVVNALFWGTAAFLGVLLYSSYTEKMEQLSSLSLLGVFIGLLFGTLLGFLRGRSPVARYNLLRDNLEWADTGFSAILLASVVMFFVVQAFKIPSGSMRETLIEGDHLFVNKFIYGIPIPFSPQKLAPLKKVTPGDIIIFRYPSEDKTSPHYGKDFIKRVVATEGQTVQVKNKRVFVNGVERQEPFAQHVENDIYPAIAPIPKEIFQDKWQAREFSKILGNDVRDNFGPIIVPKGDVFVMGDNRDRSFDSRFWGPLPLTAIKGKAWLLYWPINRFRVIK